MEQKELNIARTTRAGFTFIEIMVALLIVGVMMGGAFALFKYVDQARYTRTDVTLKGIQMAIDTFQANTNVYPTMLMDLVQQPKDVTVAKRWRGPYLEEKEMQDGWSREIQYQVNPKNSKHPYELYSWGKGGEGSPENEWISVWNVGS